MKFLVYRCSCGCSIYPCYLGLSYIDIVKYFNSTLFILLAMILNFLLMGCASSTLRKWGIYDTICESLP